MPLTSCLFVTHRCVAQQTAVTQPLTRCSHKPYTLAARFSRIRASESSLRGLNLSFTETFTTAVVSVTRKTTKKKKQPAEPHVSYASTRAARLCHVSFLRLLAERDTFRSGRAHVGTNPPTPSSRAEHRAPPSKQDLAPGCGVFTASVGRR